MDNRNIWWKSLILVVFLSLSLWMVIPPSQKIRLGLDLSGGLSLTVGIDREELIRQLKSHEQDITEEQLQEKLREVLKEAPSRAQEVLRNRIDNLGIVEPQIYVSGEDKINVQLPGIPPEKQGEAIQAIKSTAYLEMRLIHPQNDKYVAALFNKNLAPEGYVIVTVGRFKYYRRTADYHQKASNPEYREYLRTFQAPKGYEFMLMKRVEADVELYQPYFVKIKPEITGDHITKAEVQVDSQLNPYIAISFDLEGSRRFAVITEQNIGKQLGIVLDGTLYSAPVIRSKITGGHAQIEGRFTREEAQFLANVLKAGRLPVPLKILSITNVSPTLGKDSIKSGLRASLYGAILVIGFMIAYYMVAGLIADFALILNLILLPLGMTAIAGMLSLGMDTGTTNRISLPVLTLPGIAGIVLTLGMAVDANILVFERIREEINSGKRLWQAIQAGYQRALVTILDSNLTTLITGIILFRLGTGPIRGFAITLCAGIIVSMYTALTVTKLIFNIAVNSNILKSIKMLSLLKKQPHFDFIGKKNFFIFLSIITIVCSWALITVKLVKNPAYVLGIDFTGGTSISFESSKKLPMEKIRKVLEETGIKSPYIQFEKELSENSSKNEERLVIRFSEFIETGEPISSKIEENLKKVFPDAELKLLESTAVGAQVGKELIRSAILSLLFALTAMIIYIAIRFEFGFALGAVVALFHDVLITAGLYSAFGRQMNLPIIAGLLIIVGYSINDTIVIFDRIRERLRIDQNLNFIEICNVSINQTLSRTLLTSFTTLLAIIPLLIFGGSAVFDFSLPLLIGIIVGTYSSIFIATPVVISWYRGRRPTLGTRYIVKP